jgi:hypothetical protein
MRLVPLYPIYDKIMLYRVCEKAMSTLNRAWLFDLKCLLFFCSSFFSPSLFSSTTLFSIFFFCSLVLLLLFLILLSSPSPPYLYLGIIIFFSGKSNGGLSAIKPITANHAPVLTKGVDLEIETLNR